MNTIAALDWLRKYDYLGTQSFADGTHAIGKAPHIGPLAWLHVIYPPASEKGIAMIESQINAEVPKSYRSFLRTSNGLTVFNRTFGLYGIRSGVTRDPYATPQAFVSLHQILQKNHERRKRIILQSEVIVGMGLNYILIQPTIAFFFAKRKRASPYSGGIVLRKCWDRRYPGSRHCSMTRENN